MKKVKNPVQQRFWEEEENRIVKSVYPRQSITYEELNYSQLQPIPGEEDNWWDSYVCPTYKKGGRK